METQTTQVNNKSPHPLMWVAAIALIVFCSAGVGALMGWIPTSLGKTEQPALAVAPAAPAKVHEAPARVERAHVASTVAAPAPVAVAAAARCAECGVVQSVHE